MANTTRFTHRSRTRTLPPMHDAGSASSQMNLLLPLLSASVCWYVSSHLAVAWVAGDRAAPLRRGAAQAMPGFVLALMAILCGHPMIAVGVLFASSVAALSLVLGVVTCTAPPAVVTVEA